MPNISFGGLASGLDTGAIIQQLIAIESRPLQRLESQRSDLINKRDQFDTFKSKLKTLSDKFQALKDDQDTLRLFKGSSTDEDVVKISAQGDAVPGQYSITVNSLAKAQSTAYQSQFADTDTTTFTSAGTVDITVNGTTTQVTVGTTDTLEDLRDNINAADAGVRASIINDGTNYQLVVTSSKTGTDNAFTLTTSGLAANEDPFQTSTTLATAANASFDIDGLAITSQSNSVTDAVAGVTFELVSTSATAVDVSVTRDNSKIGDKLSELVDAYNDVLNYIDAQSDRSDVALRSIKNQLRSSVATNLDDQSFTFIGLSQVGISSDVSGRLKLDRGDLDDALEQDFDGFIEFFYGKTDGSQSGLAAVFDTVLNGDPNDDTIPGILSTGDGLLAARQESLSARIRALDSRIDISEQRLIKKEENLTRKFAAFEELTARYQAQGNFLQSSLI